MPNDSMVKIFRLLGEFQWPPSKPVRNVIKRAAVEIWFAPSAKGYQALLSWSTKGLPGKPDGIDGAISNVFMLTESEFKEHFSNDAGFLRISRGGIDSKYLREKLQFKGAVLFEQFLDKEPSKQPTQIKLKWPLVRDFSYDGGSTRSENSKYYSELVVGSKRADFRFSLVLPSPVRQTSSNRYSSPNIFILNAWYPSTDVAPNKLRWLRKKDGLSLGPKEIALYYEKVKTPVLGSFGFAISPKNTNEFAYQNEFLDQDFWPIGTHESVLDFLQLAGLTKNKLQGKVDAGTGAEAQDDPKSRNEDQVSIKPSGESTLVWRLNLNIINVYEDIGSSEQDIWTKHKKFYTKVKDQYFRTNNKELQYDVVSSWSIGDLSSWFGPSESNLNIDNIVDVRLMMAPLDDGVLGNVLDSLKGALGELPQSFLPNIPTNFVGRRVINKYELRQNKAKFIDAGKGLIPAWSGEFNKKHLPNFFGDAATDLNLVIVVEDENELDQYRCKVISAKFTKSNKTATGRLGALSFDFNTDFINAAPKEVSELRVTKTPAGFSYQCILYLNVKQVRPVTVDRPWGERELQNAPLLIKNGDEGDGGDFSLKIIEGFGDELDWQLRANLFDNSSKNSVPVTYNVITDQPFSLFRFARIPLSASGDKENAEVATYNSDYRTWQFKKVSDSYHYVLPPQSIGESTDKPRRLEIHDASADLAAGDVALKPFLIGDPTRTLLVEHRLTPSAELWIKPSDLERNYFLPEWSAHEIFRQRNDFGLGVALLGMRAEFLYGLTVGVDTSLESGPSRNARVAETEALMGRLPRSLPDNVSEEKAALYARWHLLRRAMQRRHERLELWATDPKRKQVFAPAHFADGVNFALRNSALHRAPVINPEEPVEEPQNLESKIRYHPQGLPGGALWPLEFWNVFEALCETPSSSGGTLDHVALSPTGGDANQKALFLNGIMSVISETRGGFVQRQQVEILGRIGAHWHRAKHVVVYERTVNPSAQFAPEFREGDCSHETRSRRPILRKVNEYIELLQPERGYPDGAGVAKDYGFLKSIRFNATRIAVDSAWGSEVGDVGYQIPLWNLYSARIRPQVYPMPDVVFNLLSEGEKDDTTSAKQCMDPDNIYFFADIKSRNPKTDEWTPRVGVDAVQALSASEMLNNSEEAQPNTEETYKPSVSRILPGYRRFTWRLAPGGPKVQINAGYGERPIYAEVESVSFMRSVAAVNGDKKRGLEEILNLINNHDSKYGKPWPQWSDEASGDSLVAELKRLTEKFHKEAQSLADGSKDTLPAEAAFADLKIKLETFSDAAARNYHKDVDEAKGKLGAFESPLKSCESLEQDVVDTIRRKRQLIETELSEWQNQAIATLSFLPTNTDPQVWRKKTEENLIADLKTQINPLFDAAYTPIDTVKADIEIARSVVSAAESDIERALLRVLARLDAMKAAYSDDKPWSEDRFKKFHKKLGEEWLSVRGELDAMVAEAKQRVSVELSQRSSQLSIAVHRALQPAVDRLNDGIAAEGQADNTFKQIFASINAPLAQLQDSEKGIFKQVEALLPKLKSKPQIRDEILNLLEEAKEQVAVAKLAVTDIENEANGKLESVIALAEGLTNVIKKVEADISANLKTTRDEIGKINDNNLDEVKAELHSLINLAERHNNRLVKWSKAELESLGGLVDPLVEDVAEHLREGIVNTRTFKRDVFGAIDDKVKFLQEKINTISNDLQPDKLSELLVDNAVKPWVQKVLLGVPDAWIKNIDVDSERRKIENVLRGRLTDFASEIAGKDGTLKTLERSAIVFAGDASDACKALSNSYKDAIDQIKDLGENIKTEIIDNLTPAYDRIEERIKIASQYTQILKDAENAAMVLGKAVDSLGDVVGSVQDVSHRILDAATQVADGSLAAAPNNVLKLYSAATSALNTEPMQSNIHQLRCAWDDVIRTTKGNATLSKLGDKLKALGIAIPFNSISDTFNIDEKALKNFDFSKMFKDFAGINTAGLFKSIQLPPNIKDAINLSHAFDKKQARAWVEIDVNVRMPGRNTLFAVGPFTLHFKDARLIGNLRMEASKDTDEVTETGSSTLIASIEAVVSGQVMVTLQDATLHYTEERGLQFDFDPANIKLHPSFQFIQETLGSIFPDEIGGLKIIKNSRGVPVGVEHVFTMPNMSLNFGTSGVQNIQISNRFRMLAYPDFIIANRFNLSTVEMPFIFSIFILGGSGYIQIDTEYRPTDGRLLVVVEAAAGASAGLAFAFGPVQGSVFMTLSVALSYRKLIGSNGGGLSVSLVLVVAGNVSLWGMVNVYLGIILRMTYRDNGQIDAQGYLSAEVRVSRFFKLKYRKAVTYKLRGGKAERTTTTSVDVQTSDRIKSIRKKAVQLKGARS